MTMQWRVGTASPEGHGTAEVSSHHLINPEAMQALRHRTVRGRCDAGMNRLLSLWQAWAISPAFLGLPYFSRAVTTADPHPQLLPSILYLRGFAGRTPPVLEANSVLSMLPFSLGLPAEAEPSPETELLVMRAPFMYKVEPMWRSYRVICPT
ncbi:hypothetical protein KC353_g38 [Hortaea werneckii]|nr:hypothetical protein KC353_g38 [Hortaea werneckii]